jgi:HD-GYP domain-containing protein (c-di-GMP phosphodiesterase class II)
MTERLHAGWTPWLLLPLVVVASLSIYRPGFLGWAERATYDTLVRMDSARRLAERVVIVDIDDRSLSTIGQWPWRRDVLGSLLSRVRSAGASAVAVDILLSEPERTEPNGASTDTQLADALGGGRVVIGYAFKFDPRRDAPADCSQHPLNVAIVGKEHDDDPDPFFHATSAICSLPMLTRAATGSGFLNAAPDGDGILRRVPLLIEFRGRVYPSLALAVVAAATHARADALRIADTNTLSLTLGGTSVPLDGKSDVLVRYRGIKGTFPYVSAADVLTGRVAADTFAEKIVFIGTTALGMREVVATPLDTLFASVEVQATVADNLLRGDFLRRPQYAVTLETIVVLTVGWLVLLFVGRYGLLRGAAAVIGCVAMAWAGSAILVSARGVIVSPLFPTLAAAATLSALGGARLLFERTRADHAVADKVASRHIMIQSLLSLTETRDSETGQHSRRTQRNMRILAEELAKNPAYRASLTAEHIELLSALAPLHDIGKVGIADRVLSKPGALTDDEIAEMRTHPILGRDVIARVQAQLGDAEDADGVLQLAKDIVYTHHEKWDGTGYPQRLRGRNIPIAGRLMAVVDVYDAVVMHRRYQPSRSHDEAITIIVDGRGTHFDPAVVDAFLNVSAELALAGVPDGERRAEHSTDTILSR